MILHFINTKKIRLAITLLPILIGAFFNNAFSAKINKFFLPDNSGYIWEECDNDLCDIYLKKKNANKVRLLHNTVPPSIKTLSKDLISLYFSCGSPCNYTIFFDSKFGISNSFEFVIAVGLKNKMVVVAEKNHLVVYKMFDKLQRPLFSIERNWSPTATLYSSIIEAKLINNILYVKYLAGKNFEEKMEKINLAPI